MTTIVHLLCALTSTLCAALLARAYRKSKARLLFFCACCFVGLALNNIGLVLDLLVFPEVHLALVRTTPALVGLMLLVGSLVLEDP